MVEEKRESTGVTPHPRRRHHRQPPVLWAVIALCAVVVVILLAVLLTRGSGNTPLVSDTPAPVEDTQPPEITGTKDLTVAVGESLSYRTGVTVTDDVDESVQLQVDSSGVNRCTGRRIPPATGPRSL